MFLIITGACYGRGRSTPVSSSPPPPPTLAKEMYEHTHSEIGLQAVSPRSREGGGPHLPSPGEQRVCPGTPSSVARSNTCIDS